MTDKEVEKEKVRIKKLANKWMSTLGLNWWTKIDISYHRTEDDGDGPTAYSPKALGGEWVCPMSVTCDPNYLTAEIKVFMPFTSKLDDRELEETFLHEVSHIILSPMHHKQTSKEEELVATKLAQAFYWTRSAGEKKKTISQTSGLTRKK